MKQKGFTIVEILIVIIVIGILASIGVVAYNGATQRARNGARLAAVNQAKEAVETLLTAQTPLEVRGTLNVSGTWYSACIGTGYQDVNGGTGTGDCGVYNGTVYVSESAAFNTMMQAKSGLPNFGQYPPSKSTDGDVVSGPYLETMRIDGIDRLGIEYSLEGTRQKCDNTPLVYGSGATASFTPIIPADAAFSSSGDGVTECRFVVATL